MPKKLKNKPSATALITTLLVILIFSPGCVRDVKPKRNVTVFVIDDFITGQPSHGELVIDIIRESSLDKCEIKPLNIRPIVSGKQGHYIESLNSVLKYTEDYHSDGIVVNISLGSYEYNLIEHLLIQELSRNDVIIVAAAGNDNTSRKQYPAGYKQTIAVAAVVSKSKADYSNYGDHIDLCAPGFGDETFLKREEDTSDPLSVREIEYYQIRGGTSFAAPRVSGLIAYLLRQRPELTPQQVVELVKSNSTLLAKRRFHTAKLGSGRINSYKTILTGDPRYQRIVALQVTCVLAAVLILGVLNTYFNGIFFSTLFLLGPATIGAGFILIRKLGLIKGSIAGSCAFILAAVSFPLIYIGTSWRKEKEQEKQRFINLLRTGNLIALQPLLVRFDINKKLTASGNTSLHIAVEYENTEAVNLLIAAGADPNAKNNYGKTPLHTATKKGYIEIIKLLISAGADTDIKDRDDRTATDLARRSGHSDIVNLFEIRRPNKS